MINCRGCIPSFIACPIHCPLSIKQLLPKWHKRKLERLKRQVLDWNRCWRR